MPLKLAAKEGVVWIVNEAIEAAQDAIAQTYKSASARVTVTSAKDGAHSAKSAHRQRQGDTEPASAIDLRIWGLFPKITDTRRWYQRILLFCEELAVNVNAAAPKGWRFIVLLEADHIHLEAYRKGTPPNLKGFLDGRAVYWTKDVDKKVTQA